MTQFLDGGSSGPNGRDGRTVRSSEQDPAGPGDQSGESPDALGGRGSLMSRYRGPGSPAGTEDEAAPPQPRTGEMPAPETGTGSPWRDSGWTSAPAVPHSAPPAPPAGRPASAPPAPPASSAPPAPPAPPARPSVPAASAPAVTPAGDKPALDRPAAPVPAPELAPAVDKPSSDKPTGSVDKPTGSVDKPAGSGGSPADRMAGESSPRRPVEPGGTTADAAPVVTVTRGVTPGAGTSTAPLLPPERTGEFKQRWRDLQGEFVDDPQQAVRGAGELAREVLRELSDAIADSERVEGWQAGDGSTGTEDLRVALRQYRTLVDRLLEL